MKRNNKCKGLRNSIFYFENGGSLKAFNVRVICTDACCDYEHCENKEPESFCSIVDEGVRNVFVEFEKEIDTLELTPLQLKRVGVELAPLYAQRCIPTNDMSALNTIENKIQKTWSSIVAGGTTVELEQARKKLERTKAAVKDEKLALMSKAEREKLAAQLDDDAPVPAWLVPIFYWQLPFDATRDYSFVQHRDTAIYWQNVFEKIIDESLTMLISIDPDKFAYVEKNRSKLRRALEQAAFELCRIDYRDDGRRLMKGGAVYEADSADSIETIKKGWSSCE